MMASHPRRKITALLPVALGLAALALLEACGDRDNPGGAAESSSVDVALRGITLARDYRNARLVLEVSIRNTTGKAQLLAPPFLRLVDANNAGIPPFFLAFDQPPTLAPGESGTHELAFWLDERHLAGEIRLLVGQHAPVLVKDAGPFDLDSIDNQQSRGFDGPSWQEHPGTDKPHR